MFGTPSVSHEWDALAFGLSTIPTIVTMLLIAAAYWEQWRNRVGSHREPALHERQTTKRMAYPGHAAAGSSAIVG